MGLKKVNFPLIASAIAANFISLTAGSAFAWTSPVIPKLKSEESPFGAPINIFEESLITSLVGLGATFGPIIGGFLTDRIGRKKSLLLITIPLIVSHLVLAFATRVDFYYFSRFFLGIGAGCIYSIMPMFIGEISEDSNRGTLGCLMGINSSLGTLLTFTIGPFVTIKVLSLICTIPSVLFLLTSHFVPESPYFLILKGREEEAIAALEKLRIGDIKLELNELKAAVFKNSQQHQFWKLIKNRAIKKGLIIATGLMIFQQFTGVCAILSYAQPIFEASGSKIDPKLSVIVIGVIQLVMSIVTSQLIDRLGRKILTVTSLIGMFVSLVFLGFYFYLSNNNYDELALKLFWVPITSVIIYMVMLSIGIGPVAWVIMGELFPPNFKSIGVAWTTTTALFCAFLITIFFPKVAQLIGMAQTFWIFSGMSILGAVFVGLVVPETKGKSLQKIQDMLEGKNIDLTVK